MPETEKSEASSGPDANRNKQSGTVVARNKRNLMLTSIDTAEMLDGLHGLFQDVMSGKEYDEDQVKNATLLTNTIIKVLRFEFDVYKHFDGRAQPEIFAGPVGRAGPKPRDDFVRTPIPTLNKD